MTATDAAGVEKTATSDEDGRYAFSSPSQRLYTVRVNRDGFSPFENPSVEVTAGRTEPLNIVLTIAIEQEEMTAASSGNCASPSEARSG